MPDETYTIGVLLFDLLVELRDDGRITNDQYQALRAWQDEACKLCPDTAEAPPDPPDEDE